MNTEMYINYSINEQINLFTCSHGVLRNLINHFECSCFGLFRPDGTDWMNKFDVHDQVYTAPRSFLTNARDNYQFV